MDTDSILIGIGLVVVLGVGAQLLAGVLRVPSIVLLLPAGFLAGIATDDVHPDRLLGDLFQPLVGVGVGLILFEAGLRLSVDELRGGTRRIVSRLLLTGIVVTWAGVTVAVLALFDVGRGSAVMIGAILIVSGPTVVMPLLDFIRPAGRVRTVLKWEGILTDPIGALIGVVVFHILVQGAGSVGTGEEFGEILLSLGTGLLFGVAGAGALMLLLRGTERVAPSQGVMATLMVVVAAVVAADVLRDDTGLVAATVMGVVLANQRRLDVDRILEFQETFGQLLIGILFVLLAASVGPDEVRAVLGPGVALIAVMVLLLRPLVVLLATWRTALTWPERAFAAWMAPRGIVAASTASAFGLGLVAVGLPGAQEIQPIVFVVIFGTVVLYGLTAGPLARALGVADRGHTVALVVGAHQWAREVAGALGRAGVNVRLWAEEADEAEAARAEGLAVREGSLVVDALALESELEEVHTVLLLTGSDAFNVLAGRELRNGLARGAMVYRLAPGPEVVDAVPARIGGQVAFGPELTYEELSRRFAAGDRLVALPDGAGALSARPLFVVTAHGDLRVVRPDAPARPRPGDTVIALSPGGSPR